MDKAARQDRLDEVLSFYVYEQCRYVQYAHDRLVQVLRPFPKTHHKDREFVFRVGYELQSFVGATANISKALWGTDTKVARRRAALREKLRVADDSPLRARSLRNHVEHMDERLERWASSTTSNQLTNFTMATGRPYRWRNPLLGEYDSLLEYWPDAGLLHFWDSAVDMNAVVAEAQRLMDFIPTMAAEVPPPTAR